MQGFWEICPGVLLSGKGGSDCCRDLVTNMFKKRRLCFKSSRSILFFVYVLLLCNLYSVRLNISLDASL